MLAVLTVLVAMLVIGEVGVLVELGMFFLLLLFFVLMVSIAPDAPRTVSRSEVVLSGAGSAIGQHTTSAKEQELQRVLNIIDGG